MNQPTGSSRRQEAHYIRTRSSGKRSEPRYLGCYVRLAYFAGLIAWLAFYPLLAQVNPAQRHEMATNQLKRLALEMSAGCLNDIHSRADWKRAQPKLRQQLLEMLGLDPLPKRTPLKVQITGRLDKPAYQIEKIVFQSLPGLYVT